MADWNRVKWSEARQVLAILGAEAEAEPADAGVAPAAYFESLRQAGRRVPAVKFLGQALPRLEAVAWAARTVRDLAPPDQDRSKPEARALRAALLWIGDPSESRRRSAQEAGRLAAIESPEHLAAMAVFYSGGSIAPAHCPAVAPSRDAAGRFASVAVICAAIRTSDQAQAFDFALDAGARIAAEGLEAVSA